MVFFLTGLNWTSGLFYFKFQDRAQAFALELVMSVKGTVSQVWSGFLSDVIYKPFLGRN